MVATADDILLGGVYTLDQAARIARLSTKVLRRWMDADGGKAALIRHMPRSDADTISFVDLVQSLAIRAIRNKRKLSLQKIRQTIDAAAKMGITYPFARKHKTYLFADDVVLRVDLPGGEQLVQVTGKYKWQECIKPIVELYLEDLTWDDTGLAQEYCPLRDEERAVVLNPRIKYGAPIVRPCGYTASALVNAVDSEGSPVAAAEAYGVDIRDVMLALRYDDLLAGRAA